MNKYLVMGLGSMGKRRVRCLKSLGVSSDDIIGYDIRTDRCQESWDKYGILTIDSLEKLDFEEIRAVIVSLPPDKHAYGAEIAVKNEKPVFIEASVMTEDVERIKSFESGQIVAPSCTMVFHPMVKEIKKIVTSGKYGKVCNFSFHTGDFLPQWHPWENVKDFYVSNRSTGGAREIVPFDMTWIVDILGFPKEVKGFYRKTRDVGCDIEDSYAFSIAYEDMLGTILVDVVGRSFAKNILINLEEGQILWNWNKELIEVYDAKKDMWGTITQDKGKHENGYDKNIIEDMYIDEIASFLDAVGGKIVFPNTLEKDLKILSILDSVENSDGGFERGIL